MKITALEEYGLRCVVCIAIRYRGEPLTVAEIASREGLTVPHVAKLMTVLRERGLVDSVRGRGGGYVLTRSPAEISVDDVLSALGEPLFPTAYCSTHPGVLDVCRHQDECSIRSVWELLGQMIHDVLRKTSIADLCRQAELGRPVTPGGRADLLEIARSTGPGTTSGGSAAGADTK
jgi:Rrf2 family iron-sulfur cluster assembly transcriptional regulator